jgi:hypothetical protein
MMIANNIIKEISHLDEENITRYVYVSNNFSEKDFNKLINKLNTIKRISIKNIEQYSFVILMKNENNYQYNVELISGLNNENFFRISKDIKTV